MDVVLAVMTRSPYRESVAQFADEFAARIKGRVRVLSPSQPLRVPDDTTPGSVMEDPETLLNRAEVEAEQDVERLTSGKHVAIEGAWSLGPPVAECLRTLAECDFGVVGKTMRGPLPAAQGLGRQVEQLKRACTKPLIIVSEKVRPIRKALFVYTDHPEAGHALSLAIPLSEAGVEIALFSAIQPAGRDELRGTGTAYLQEHRISHNDLQSDCSHCMVDGGPVAEVLFAANQQDADLVVMGGTRRTYLGRLLWPEMAREVAWSIEVPLLIWY